MRYYSTQRPIVPGSLPKPKDNKVIGVCNYDDKTYCEEIKREAWGYIDYEKPLTAKEVNDYELTEGKFLEIPKPQYKNYYPDYACGCGCFNQPKEREDCCFYHGEYHMGGTIPTCNYYEKLGYCPCESCNKYVPRKEVSERVFKAVKEYVDKREV